MPAVSATVILPDPHCFFVPAKWYPATYTPPIPRRSTHLTRMHNQFIASGAMTVFSFQISPFRRTCGDGPTVFIRTSEEDCANVPVPG